ncbi:hypothetical protein E2C01_070816 [Portunus trituberculatus]|uniref:Uncharacterized protein n=1 Tax=Portunus trituberculatus TaxID=210409 RepID=A0A5B7I380_PORTR|nr:hypothetical protein [Portunus trituberculatus]
MDRLTLECSLENKPHYTPKKNNLLHLHNQQQAKHQQDTGHSMGRSGSSNSHDNPLQGIENKTPAGPMVRILKHFYASLHLHYFKKALSKFTRVF